MTAYVIVSSVGAEFEKIKQCFTGFYDYKLFIRSFRCRGLLIYHVVNILEKMFFGPHAYLSLRFVYRASDAAKIRMGLVFEARIVYNIERMRTNIYVILQYKLILIGRQSYVESREQRWRSCY